MNRLANFAFAAAACSLLPLAHGADVAVEAWSIASPSAGPGGSNVGCANGTFAGFDCRHAGGRIGGNRDPLSYSTDAQMHFEFSSNNLPATEPPNFVYDANAHASASMGSLHASAGAQVQGHGATPGATNIPNSGASGRARAKVIDTFTVRSATLAQGTSVTLESLLDVSGNGPGALSLEILSFFGAVQEQNIRLSDGATFGESLADISTSFLVRVGSLVRITYTLEASSGVFVNNWRPIDILNGRSNNSDYANSAHMYIQPTVATPDVRLDNGTTFSYAFPVSTVPMPGGAVLMLSGLPLIGFAMARRRRAMAA